jgi:metalloendopeptidase OMA1, mitochondrial
MRLEINAFVIPGGKVFVYSGLLKVATTDDQLATILGHEIAHNLARHAAEQLSRSVFVIMPIQTMIYLLDSMGLLYGLGQLVGRLLLDFGVSRPASRVQESEADYIGLMMMARSCYNPQAAVEVWDRMEQANKNNIPEWLSTHPSNVNRGTSITGWLTKAEDARESSDCAATLDYQRQFKGAMGQLRDLYSA